MGNILDAQRQDRTDSHARPQGGDENCPLADGSWPAECGEHTVDFVLG